VARILALSNMYPPHSYGGYELSCRDVMDRFRTRGHDVSVLTTTMRVPGVEDPVGERAAGIWRDLDFYWRDHQLLTPSLARTLAIERANQAALEAALERARPDVVSVWNMGAMSLGLLATLRRRNVPMVLAVCDDWLDYGRRLDRWSERFAGRPRAAAVVEALTGLPAGPPEDLGSAGAFCFVTDLTRRRAEAHTPWSYPVATVVYSGVDTRDFPAATGGPPDRPWRWRLLYVGRLDARKGVETAVRALHLLPGEATLDIVGGGDTAMRARLDRVAGRLGLTDRVAYDFVARSALADRYRASDVFLFPSAWDEPFGLVPVEAMACDTPVVATRRGGAAEFLSDGQNCLTFAAGDERGLATAVARLASDPDLRRHLIAGGRATAADLTVDRLADVLEEWHLAAATRYSNGIPAHRPPPPGARTEPAPSGQPGSALAPSSADLDAVVVEMLDRVGSPVAYVGEGDRPDLALRISAGGSKVMAVDRSPDRLQRVRSVATRHGMAVPAVAADADSLPFRDLSLAGAVGELEGLAGEARRTLAELARATEREGIVVATAGNRLSAQALWRRARHRLRLRHRSEQEEGAEAGRWTWGEIEEAVKPGFVVLRRDTVGWPGTGWRHVIANAMTRRPPFRRFSPVVVMQLRPSDHEPAGPGRPGQQGGRRH